MRKRNKITRNSAQRIKLPFSRNRLGQEEMVGFIVIIVLVSVILLVLLGFLLRKPGSEMVESYEVESFIQSALQYTSDCETQTEFLSLQDLMAACEKGEICLNGIDSCEVLNITLKNMIESAWNINEKSAVKGYKLSIMIEEEEKLLIKEGNETKNYKGAFQDFVKEGNDYEISLNVYY
jgi:hypothetical protein